MEESDNLTQGPASAGMESRRRAKEGERNGSAVGGGEKTPASREEARKLRKELQQQYEREKRTWNAIRWTVAVAVLILAVVGFWYYIAYYRPNLTVSVAAKARSVGREKPRTKDKSPKSDAKKTAKSSEAGAKDAKKTRDDRSTKDEKTSPKRPRATDKKSDEKPAAAAPKTKSKPPASDAEKAKKSKKSKDSKASKTPKAQAQAGDSHRTGGGKTSRKPPTTFSNPGRKNYSVRENGLLREELHLNKIRLLRRPIGPSDPDRPYIVQVLNGDNLLRDERWNTALEKFNEILKMFPASPRAIYGKAVALENLARQKKSNKLLDTAIEFYQKAGMETFQAQEDLKVAALMRLADLSTEQNRHQLTLKALEKLQEIRGRSASIDNKIGLAHLAVGSNKKAKTHFTKVVEEFPDNHFAKAHMGFLLFLERRYEEALPLLLEGIHRDRSIKTNAKFYLYAGECLMRLDRMEEAFAIYGEAVSLDLIPSVWQRSLYNEPGLTARGWWTAQETGYQPALERVEKALGNITEEAVSVIDSKTGKFLDGSIQFVLISNGKKNAKNCGLAPMTCALVESFPEALTCRRGETKFTVFPPRTHVQPHVGPTNTRLEVIAGLRLSKGLRIRVAEESSVLQEGQVAVLDDSFEQELWYEGGETGVVMTMDVWHPDLSEAAVRKLASLV